MALNTHTFHLVEFLDGLQIVPENWIQNVKNKCWYPNYKTDKEINKAIKKRQTHQDDWLSCPIKRVFGIYESYSEARSKLKKAEIISDINTDTDEKTQRKIKAKRTINNDDDNESGGDDSDYETCLPPYPKPPINTNKKNVQKEKDSNNQNINNQSSKTSSYKLIYSSIEQRRCHDVDLSDQEVTDNTSKNCSVSAKSSLNSIGRGTEPKDEYNAIKFSLQRIERSLADIKFDLHHLTEQFEITRNNLNSNVNQSRERCPMPNNTLSKMSFPLKTVEEIELLQFILTSNEEGIKESIFNMLAAIGGSSYEEMSKRMFIYVFTNEAASAYSWVGGKGKRKLYHFELMKIMLSK
ncbi:uncharacterized protein LOC113005331 isoform X2 [Solenopsis invicta]|nr:uncharacterized protein LOC113005331 isoform X2 [Solenopsis invicta]XP_039302882.1 uncharacterized protein LOC113005331 isoform X2 [Solenopsis invicta]